jgi:hypothetical protein
MPHAPIASPLCSFGHIASYAELLDAFHDQESAVLPFRMRGGLTMHLRSDTYVCAHVSDAELSAAWCGGQLDCVTVLADAGLPVDVGSAELHLRLSRGDSRAAARRHEHAPTSHVHWSRLRTPLPSVLQAKRSAYVGEPVNRLRVPLREALRQAMTTCLSYAKSAEVVEALASSTLCSPDDVAHAIAVAPRRVERALRELGGIPGDIDIALASLRSGHRF